MTTSRSTIILVVLAIVVVLAALYMLFGKENETDALGVAGAPATEAELTFLNFAAQLEPVAFDTSILSDPRFMSLTDIRTTIVPEPTGRRDPFAPL